MPLRAAPSHKAEMVTQALFGECLEVTDTAPDGWMRVKCGYDGYEGWGTQSQVCGISENFYHLSATGYTGEWINEILFNNRIMRVPLGCPLPDPGRWKEEGLPAFAYHGRVIEPADKEASGALALKYALEYLNTPYLWGGRSPFGIDCSGLTQGVFKLMGVRLPRDAWQQALEGEEVKSPEPAVCGDLAFFANKDDRVTHVGILLGDDGIIHSAGRVRVDRTDGEGIINSDTGERTHRLKLIRRYF